MSYVLNAATDFAAEAADGFVLANRELVRRVPGGVARRTAIGADRVAIVIGGGSGHYPAFAGLVGDGGADAAAMGNVFASPSAEQVYTVARSVAGPAGVLLTYGNYAGDVLNFDQAQERLRAEGIPTQTVTVTDDVASAPESESDQRRGIAGDLPVFRAAAWAAAQGRSLEQVAEFARHANQRTRTLGVAFGGCTLPGADAPLFDVPAGSMAIGMGVHGEPGIETRELVTSAELAELFSSRLLSERPSDSGDRVAVIVNGLGAIKGEELHVLFGDLARRLQAAGLTIVDPDVGEFVTSFEMAGVSVTVVWLDEELEQAWTAPAYTPAYRKGLVDRSAAGVALEDETEARDQSSADPGVGEHGVGDPDSQRLARRAAEILASIAARIDAEADELGRLDSVAGDGDHGIGMRRGSGAARDAAVAGVAEQLGLAATLSRSGDAWAAQAGGTSGALWGAGLNAAASGLGDSGVPSSADVVSAIARARAAVVSLGKAQLDDKTMVDAVIPFEEAFTDAIGSGRPLAQAWTVAAEAATRAAADTADLVARLGRARTHHEHSRGTPDPGAVSFASVMSAVADALADSDAS